MPIVTFELQIDFDGHWTPEKPAVLNPPPGEPSEPEEIEINHVNRVTVEGYNLSMDDSERYAMLDHLLNIPTIRETIEQAVRDEYVPD